jgi:hypothetical protein
MRFGDRAVGVARRDAVKSFRIDHMPAPCKKSNYRKSNYFTIYSMSIDWAHDNRSRKSIDDASSYPALGHWHLANRSWGLTLFAPTFFFETMGLSAPPADNKYMLGMLAARFFAYGLGMFGLARQAVPDLFWIRNMILIQLIDLGAGAFYLATGVIGLSVAAFPMFNATVFAVLLYLWSKPDGQRTEAAPSGAGPAR